MPADLLSTYPDELSPAQAAALWVPYLTAYGIVLKGEVAAGDVVVLTAGNSAISLAAIQIVRDAGALPVPVVRSNKHVERLKELGAHDVIVTGEEDYRTRIAEITEGAGPRITFDAPGGDFVVTAAQAAAPGGVIIEYGILGGMKGRFPAEFVIGKDITIRGYTVGEVSTNPEQREMTVQYVLDRAKAGRFSPAVARTFALDDVQAAFDYIQTGPELGRTILVTEV